VFVARAALQEEESLGKMMEMEMRRHLTRGLRAKLPSLKSLYLQLQTKMSL
jgi:hypothetical protein